MKKHLLLLASTALLGTAGLPAQAQTFGEIMQDLGLQSRPKHKMDFSERAPLVIPPSLDQLPAPEDGSALAAANPNWPTDPDLQREIAEEENTRKQRRETLRTASHPAQQIYQIRAREREQGVFSDSSGARSYDADYQQGRVLTPEELREVQRREAAAKGAALPQAYVEPERARLTDPPAGYRQPSAAQPFGPGEEKKKKGFLSKLNPFGK